MVLRNTNSFQLPVHNDRFQKDVYYFNSRLLDSLNNLFKTPITIVSAPIGYGKTTAVRVFLSKTNAKILWMNTYSSYENDFWNSFCREISSCHADISSRLMDIGLPNDSSEVFQAVELVVKCRFNYETALVVDDYHLIEGKKITSFILALAKKAIPHFHIVVLTREKFPYDEELLLGGYVNLITADVFSLNKIDIDKYFQKYNLTLSESTIELITKYTEGWMSALNLIVQSELKNKCIADNIAEIINSSGLLESIMKLIYQPLPAECKQFLFQLCYLSDFSEKQAAYLLVDTSNKMTTKQIITMLTDRNAFLYYDESKSLYHMHYLFCKVLRMNFDKLPKELKGRYLLKIGNWYALQMDYSLAIHYFCMAEYYNGVFQFLSNNSIEYYSDNDIPMLVNAYQNIKPESTVTYYKGMLTLASKLYFHNEYYKFREITSDFEKLLDSDVKIEKVEKKLLWSEYEIIQCISNLGDIYDLQQHIDRAYAFCPKNRKITLRLDCLTGSPSIILLYYRKPSSFKTLLVGFTTSMKQYGQLTEYDATGVIYFLRAEIQFFRCHFNDAEILLYCALRLAKKTKDYSLWIACCFLNARILLFKGRLPEAFETMRHTSEVLKQKELYGLTKTADICQAWLYLLSGQTENVAKWLCNLEEAEKFIPKHIVPAIEIVNGVWLLSNRDYTRYISYFVDHGSRSDDCPNILLSVYRNLCLAAAYKSINRIDDATAHYTEAMEIALADELYIPFVELDSWLSDVANRITSERYAVFIKTIKEKSKNIQHALGPALLGDIIRNGDILTKREKEITALIQDGLKNREIAEQLFISENTVKSALKSIFRKLGVSSRKEIQINQKPPVKTTRSVTR